VDGERTTQKRSHFPFTKFHLLFLNLFLRKKKKLATEVGEKEFLFIYQVCSSLDSSHDDGECDRFRPVKIISPTHSDTVEREETLIIMMGLCAL